ncbi:amidohydrolase [Actinomycetota bacterium]
MTTQAHGILTNLDGIRGDLESLYKELHAHPELSHEETRTAGIIAERLKTAGAEVHEGIGGTGVVGVIANGDGPTVLLRADIDGLPVKEATGLEYASTQTVDRDGQQVPVMHACGHDVHITGLLGATTLFALQRQSWSGTLIALFQPAEEVADGARTMVADGLVDRIPKPDVCLAQHVLAQPAGTVATRAGALFSAADSLRITIHGRGAHGSMPHAGIDPVVIAANVVVQLQQVVSRFIAPTETAVVTVGAIHAGTKSNVIPETAELLVNTRTYSEAVRASVLEAIERIVTSACEGAGAPKPPTVERYDTYPLTTNDDEVTAKVADAFAAHFGDAARELPMQVASEDFSEIPVAFGVPYTYWGLGGADPDAYAAAESAGKLNELPVNHSPFYAPVMQPTLDTGVSALVVAAMAWLGK